MPAAAAKIVFYIPPTSAAAERVFARVEQMYGDYTVTSSYLHWVIK